MKIAIKKHAGESFITKGKHCCLTMNKFTISKVCFFKYLQHSFPSIHKYSLNDQT